MAVSVQTYEREIWNPNTEIALIRFSFRHLRRHPHIRAEFINERAEQILNGWRQFARAEPEEFCGYENVLPTFAKKETDWLRANLEAVIEFSEHRLNQMELIVRHALFEAVLTDVVGNILWEYHLIQDSIHSSFEPPKAATRRRGCRRFSRETNRGNRELRGQIALPATLRELRYKKRDAKAPSMSQRVSQIGPRPSIRTGDFCRYPRKGP